jgi:hypothetical protein
VNERPESLSLMMHWFADYIVLRQRSLAAGDARAPARDIAADLRMLADWFEDHPKFDASLYQAVFGERAT